MEEKVKKELDTLKQMLLNWRESYLGWIENGDNEWLIRELQDEISIYMWPLIGRFREMKHLTFKEEQQFRMEISESVGDFAKDVMAGKRKKKKVEVDVQKLLSQFEIHKKLISRGHGGHDFIIEQKVKLADLAISLMPALVQKFCKCEGK